MAVAMGVDITITIMVVVTEVADIKLVSSINLFAPIFAYLIFGYIENAVI